MRCAAFGKVGSEPSFAASNTEVRNGPKTDMCQIAARVAHRDRRDFSATSAEIPPLHPSARCSRQMMNTPLAMITAAPTNVSMSGISFQIIQPRSVAQMMAV
ncbi:hypothetical protein HPDFL43_00028550 [Hoeflea phototrophica DFL-43]|uniref:Uncharacterized protein n=1 Tax=Hoeflea phototrophica (strain DSM 17068 / NCIMB 14078 / DFL-43) TaxID=411684 RepID=A0A094Z262_HOEPD|nr:hypothetical protein HPDFL43_00028550 [Hoeflea phototrophica DFL-43]